jgi:hypothetical protein
VGYGIFSGSFSLRSLKREEAKVSKTVDIRKKILNDCHEVQVMSWIDSDLIKIKIIRIVRERNQPKHKIVQWLLQPPI